MDEQLLSKRHLVAWVAQLLALPIQALEQCANGAVYCQLVDAFFAGAVGMQKVVVSTAPISNSVLTLMAG